MPAKLTRTEDGLALDLKGLRGSSFSDVLAKAKEVPGRRYDGKNKLWLFPEDPAIAERVMLSIQPDADKEITDWITASKQATEQELVTALPDDAELFVAYANARAEYQPEEINGEPFTGLKPHQRALIAALVEQGDEIRAVVADDMGLGKTTQAITTVAEAGIRAAETLEAMGPKLIVCPSSVKGVWAREIKRWLGPDEYSVNVNGTTPKARLSQLEDAIKENAWAIVNYEQLRVTKEERKLRNGGVKKVTVMKQPLFETTPWACVIADEAHRAKNRKAAQTKGLFKTRGKIMLALTGTPLMNSPDELWALLHWLYPQEYTSYWRFFETYVEYTEGYMGKVITGVKNPDALRFALNGKMYRRTKKQVLDLPEKTRITVPVILGKKQRELYNDAETRFWLEVEKAVVDEEDTSAARLIEAAEAGASLYSIPNGAARTVRLRQILSSPALLEGEDDSAKLDAVVEAIVDNKHKQHVVFSEFVMTCQLLVDRLEAEGIPATSYTGETSTIERTRIEDAFQAGTIKVVIGTIGAMREGLTLTASDTVHFVERAWVPGWNEQAEDRLHRIGQRNAVTVYIYEAVDSVDDRRVKPTLSKKENLISTVILKDHVEEA